MINTNWKTLYNNSTNNFTRLYDSSGKIIYDELIPNEYVMFTALKPNSTVLLTIVGTPPTGKTWLYSTDETNWTDCDDTTLSGLTFTLANIGDCICLKSPDEIALATGGTNYHQFVMSGKIKASGELMSFQNFRSAGLSNYSMKNLFSGCTALYSISKLSLTTSVVGMWAMNAMFYDCYNIKKGMELPATTIGSGCYNLFYRNCSSMITGPTILPAPTLASQCYYRMFDGCSSLEKAPYLPALNIGTQAYRFMFLNCKSLNYVKAMFTTDISADTSYPYTNTWLSGVSSTGTFVVNTDAKWPSTIVRGVHTIPTGWTIETAEPDDIPTTTSIDDVETE